MLLPAVSERLMHFTERAILSTVGQRWMGAVARKFRLRPGHPRGSPRRIVVFR